MLGAFTPPLTMASAGDAFRAYFNAGVPQNVPSVYLEIYPDWDSENFFPEQITWIKTGGADALFELNPTGYTPPPGGFVLRASRNAVGGAGTSASVRGVTEGGRVIDFSFNMAQYFVVGASPSWPTSIETVIGSTVRLSGSCGYGSGTTRTAQLYRVDQNTGASIMLAQLSGNTSGANLITTFDWDVVIDGSGTYYFEAQDAFGRNVRSAFCTVTAENPLDFKVKVDGVYLQPWGFNPSQLRLTPMRAGTYQCEIETVPPSSSNIPGNPVALSLDSAWNQSKITVTLNPADDHKFTMVVPAAPTANGSGGLTLRMGGAAKVVAMTVPSPFPQAPLTGVTGGAFTGGTVTNPTPTSIEVSMPLSGGAKTMLISSIPSATRIDVPPPATDGDTTIATCVLTVVSGTPNQLSAALTPKKVGSTTFTFTSSPTSSDPAVTFTVKVTVT